jgi:hypothetical protein
MLVAAFIVTIPLQFCARIVVSDPLDVKVDACDARFDFTCIIFYVRICGFGRGSDFRGGWGSFIGCGE